MVFENPALPIPENSKAKHPTSILNHNLKKTHVDGSGGSHSVFGSPALPIPENPKAEHPTPVSWTTFYMILMLREEEDKTIKVINPAESLPNRPTPPKPIKLQLASPKLEILRAGLPKVELDKRDSVLRPAIDFRKTPHLPEMPNSIQDQLKKVHCKPLSRHGKALHKIQTQQHPKSRNKSRVSQQFAKEGGRPVPNLSRKTTVQKQVL